MPVMTITVSRGKCVGGLLCSDDSICRMVGILFEIVALEILNILYLSAHHPSMKAFVNRNALKICRTRKFTLT